MATQLTQPTEPIESPSFTVKIRPAAAHDTPSLRFLRQERAVLLRQSDPRLGAFLQALDQLEAADFTALLATHQPAAANPNPIGLLVGENTVSAIPRVVGYILGMTAFPSFTLPANVGVILDLALDAHQYHAGLGRLLYTDLRAWFIDHATQQIWVAVPRYHAVEQAFWRSISPSVTLLHPAEHPQLLALHTALHGRHVIDWIQIRL